MSNLSLPIKEDFIEVYKDSFIEAFVFPEQSTMLCRAISDYIPDSNFRRIMTTIGEEIKSRHLTRMIFDKRALKGFNQESMIWYHIYWKEAMWRYGLRIHRKLLPKDELFRNNVKISKKKIINYYPEFDFGRFDIKYSHSLDEALYS